MTSGKISRKEVPLFSENGWKQGHPPHIPKILDLLWAVHSFVQKRYQMARQFPGSDGAQMKPYPKDNRPRATMPRFHQGFTR